MKIEKTEQYARIDGLPASLEADFSQEFSKRMAGLYREGYTSVIVDLAPVAAIGADTLGMIRKAHELCLREGGLLVLVTKNDALIETLDGARIEDLTILPTAEEAIDAIYMNDLESEFREEEDDEYDYGMGGDEEEGGSEKAEE